VRATRASYRGPVTRREDDPAEVYRITGAPASRSADLDRRVHRYLISMALRTACVLLVFVVPGPAKWVFGAGAVFLPYVAVVFANATDRRPGSGPDPVDHRALGPGTGPSAGAAGAPPSGGAGSPP
jgi:Protein of unknown function (DUF3099)